MTVFQTQAERMAKPEIITIGDKTYTVLFPDLVRPLTDRERQDLKDSINTFGIKSPVVIDTDNGIIDGANRARIAAELGLPVVPTRVVECANDEEKRRLALSLNLDRRHLTPEERKKMVQTRKKRVQQARAAGKSYRTIAEEEGISHVQVKKDLEGNPGVNQLTPGSTDTTTPADESAPETSLPSPSEHNLEPSDDMSTSPEPTSRPPAETVAPVPATVKGRDGKTYSSRRRGKKAARNLPAVCSIKGLVKPIKKLVEKNKVTVQIARAFAAKFDAAGQKQFLSGRDEAGICSALAAWHEEQEWVRWAEHILSPWNYRAFEKWDAAKVSPECRQQVLAHLVNAKSILDKIIAVVDGAAEEGRNEEQDCYDRPALGETLA